MKYILPEFIPKQLASKSLTGVFDASVIFVDISGFTPLTEALMQHGTEGAEILSDILSRIFNPLVKIVCDIDGIIPHFAGDAFVVIFKNTTTSAENLIQISRQLNQTANENTIFETRFGTFQIQIRGGVSFGKIFWGITGKELKSFYFRGDAIERAASAINKTATGAFVFEKYFYEAAHANINLIEFENGFYKFVANENEVSTTTKHKSKNTNHAFDKNIYNNFYPGSVTENKGYGEFREVVSIFIAFAGSENYDTMNRFTSMVRQQFENFGGYLKEFDFSDKGDLVVGFFGAPVSYENNVARALECVTAIKNLVQIDFPNQNLKIGITRGLAFAGRVGGELRYQYALVGSRVNLAARLAASAPSNAVVVDESIANTPQFEFESLGTMPLKGFSKEMPTFRFLRKKNTFSRSWDFNNESDLNFQTILPRSNLMIGRDEELKTLKYFVSDKLSERKNGWIYIWGEAGIGKSRLVYELKKISDFGFRISESDVTSKIRNPKSEIRNPFWAHCPCDEILRKPLNPFIHFLKNYFKQSLEAQVEHNLRNFENIFESLIRQLPEEAHAEGAELIRTKSILSALIGIFYPDSLWQQLDAKGRYDNTITSLCDFFMALSYIQPLILEIEDGHWLDEASSDFLKLFAKKIINKPVIVIQTCRYDDEGRRVNDFGFRISDFGNNSEIRNPKSEIRNPLVDSSLVEIDLNVWQPSTLADFAESRLGDKVNNELVETLWRTTNGNPFYAEQVIDYFQENNLLSLSNEGWIITDKTIKISNSLQAVLTARIDRLSSILKETVKAAAVIGREFEVPILSEVLSLQEDYIEKNGNKNDVLKEQIDIAEKGQIWRAMSELRYIFKHTLLREAAYDMQLRTRLRELHFTIAKSIEKIYADAISDRYIDLAFHYEQAEVLPKMREYLRKAADYARYNFQNQLSLDFYDRLLKHETDNNERIKILIKKGQVLQLIGKWHESEICFHEGLFKSSLSGDIDLKGSANSALGVLLMLKGEYDTSRTYLEKSAGYYERVADTKGILEAYGHLGNLFFRQGDYENAENYFLRCLELSDQIHKTTPPLIVSNLGLTYMNQGFYEKGIAHQSEALKKCEATNDKIGQAILNVNIGIVWSEKGDIDAAMPCFERGLELANFLGNKQLTSIALGCLGNIWRLKGDFIQSLDYLEKDRLMCTELGDKQGLSIAHELIGRLLLTQGFAEKALNEFEKSLNLCRQLKYRKGIAKALLGIGECHTILNDYDSALAIFHQACDEADAINNQLIKGYTLLAKGELFKKFNRTELIENLLKLLNPIADKLGNEPLKKLRDDFMES